MPRRIAPATIAWLASALLSILSLPVAGRADALLRAPFMAIDIGGSSEFVTGADLDADGNLDLVSSTESPGGVWVALGLGDGRFAPAAHYAPSSGGSAVAIADFTGDGQLDIAMADWPNENVNILPGIGSGTFGAAIPLPIGFQCYTVAAADLNLDGHVDVIASNWDKVAVRLGAGGIVYAPPVVYQTATNTYNIAVGFLNADAYPDVVTAGDYGNVSVLLGAGDGTLLPYVTLGVGSSVTELDVADATGDGKADILVGTSSGVQLFPGDGTGGFATRADIDVVGASGRLCVSDLDGDGHPDMLLGGQDAHLYLLFGDGAGGFPVRSSFLSLHGQRGVWAGDVDGNGHADLVAGSSSGQVALHPGDGSTFGFTRRYGTGGEPVALGLGDLDGDGHADLIVAQHDAPSIGVRRGAGDGTFGIRRDYELGTSPPQALAVGDLDGDGHADVVVVSASDNGYPGMAYVSVLRGYVDGTFESIASQGMDVALAGVAIGDLNEDQKPDVVVTDRIANRVSVLLNAGAGVLQGPVHYGGGNGASGIALGDLDGDSHLDCAVANRDAGSVTILFGDGHGAFVRESELPVAAGCRSVAIGWLDQDALPDLVTANYADGSVAVLHALGGGAFSLPNVTPTAEAPTSVAIANLDADGVADLVVGHGYDPTSYTVYPPLMINTVRVLIGSAGGTFESGLYFGAGDDPQQIALADLDGNGGVDVVTADRAASTATVLMNTTTVTGVESPTPLAALQLGRGYPNPASGAVAIPFAIKNGGAARVCIYDAAGRMVRTLVDGVLSPGAHLAHWDRRTDTGGRAVSGIYFFELRASGRTATGRIVLLR